MRPGSFAPLRAAAPGLAALRAIRPGAWGAFVLGLLAALLAAAAPPGAHAEPRDGVRGGVVLRLLTYNTHGLPSWAAGDDPEARFPEIGRECNRYDVALLQEDFAHHARLREGARHPFVLRGGASRMPLCPFCAGSGLTALVGGRTGREVVSGVETHAARGYDVCAGWLGGANDCLATKGFLHLRLRLASGARLRVVDTHLDAGRADSDRAARARQLDLLAEALEGSAAGEALVVAGDLNLDFAEARDRALLEAFARRLGLRDTGAQAAPRAADAPGAARARLDYVLYRSGRGARLAVEAAGEDPAFAREGRPLSDHPALFVRFRVAPGPDGAAGLNASSTSPRRRGSPHR